jgi:hypothetical protein
MANVHYIASILGIFILGIELSADTILKYALAFITTLILMLYTTDGMRAFLYRWFDTLTMLSSLKKFHYSRIKMAFPKIKSNIRDLMIKQCQELKTDHVGFWVIHGQGAKRYASMAYEYSDNLKLQKMRMYGQQYPVKDVEGLLSAASAYPVFSYKPDRFSTSRMDSMTADFFESCVLLPFKIEGDIMFVMVFSWICKDVVSDFESGVYEKALIECEYINKKIHGLLRHHKL